MLSAKVFSKTFGEGTVIKKTENYVTVHFAIGDKEFPFPSVFDSFLSTADSGLLAEIEAYRKKAAEDQEYSKAETRLAETAWQTDCRKAMERIAAERKERQFMTDWMIPCNPQIFDVFGAFDKLETIDWNQTAKTIENGDSVYIYVSTPVQAILFKCKVLQTLIPPEKADDSDREFDLEKGSNSESSHMYYMRLKLVRKYPPDRITLEKMRSFGLKGNIQSQRRVPNELMELFTQADNEGEPDLESQEAAINKKVREEFVRQIGEKKAELEIINQKREKLQTEIGLLEEMLRKISVTQ